MLQDRKAPKHQRNFLPPPS